jgi:hypothetical protein
MISIPKPHRFEDPDFLEYLRGLPCVTCGAPPRSQPSHLHAVGARGSDYSACSQCAYCHRTWHDLGPLRAFDLFLNRNVNIFRAQADQLAAYFSTPEMVIRRATKVVKQSAEVTPAMVTELWKLIEIIVARAPQEAGT